MLLACLIHPISNIGAHLLVVGGDVGTESTSSVETVEISPGVRDNTFLWIYFLGENIHQ